MNGEASLDKLIKELKPKLNRGEYVFVTVDSVNKISREITLFEFKEKEGITIVLEKSQADKLNCNYHYVASWITLEVFSSLEAIGLMAEISKVLANNNISCNVISGYYHDHIFISKNDDSKALKLLLDLSKKNKK